MQFLYICAKNRTEHLYRRHSDILYRSENLAGEGKTWNCAVPDTKRFFKEICNLVQNVYRKLGIDKENITVYYFGMKAIRFISLDEFSSYNKEESLDKFKKSRTEDNTAPDSPVLFFFSAEGIADAETLTWSYNFPGQYAWGSLLACLVEIDEIGEGECAYHSQDFFSCEWSTDKYKEYYAHNYRILEILNSKEDIRWLCDNLTDRKFCCDKEQVYNYVNGDDSLAELVEWSFYDDSDFYMSSDATMRDVLEVIRQLLDKQSGIG